MLEDTLLRIDNCIRNMMKNHPKELQRSFQQPSREEHKINKKGEAQT